MNSSKKIMSIMTLGCKVNQYESEAIQEQFEKSGYTIGNFHEYADIYIVNTCTVTNIADKKSRQMLAKAKKQNPEALVVAVGCYAQIAKEKLEEIKNIDLLIGNTKKDQVVEIVEAHLMGNEMDNIEDMTHNRHYEELWISKNDDKTRAHIKIQDGCDQFCAYCIIPYTRGRVRSRQPESIMEEVETLVKKGFKEVVLTGIHLASYGKELDNISLMDILESLQLISGLERIRLGSLEPNLIDDAFMERLNKLDKVCPHFHLSLQSGCDETLKVMNRKYTTQIYRENVARIRKSMPDAAITTDIIVGFPGESEENFETTKKFVEEIRFADVHVFKYSEREGTVAAKMKNQIPGPVKNLRSDEMMTLVAHLKKDFLNSAVGKSVFVLTEEMKTSEEDGSVTYIGHTPNYLKVKFMTTCGVALNEIVTVMVLAVEDDHLLGRF